MCVLDQLDVSVGGATHPHATEKQANDKMLKW